MDLFGLLITSFLIGIGFAWSGALAVIAFAVIAFAERCTACACLGAANWTTSLMCAVVSGTFLALAATTATQCTKQRAIRSPALGGFRFHRVPCPSDGWSAWSLHTIGTPFETWFWFCGFGQTASSWMSFVRALAWLRTCATSVFSVSEQRLRVSWIGLTLDCVGLRWIALDCVRFQFFF